MSQLRKKYEDESNKRVYNLQGVISPEYVNWLETKVEKILQSGEAPNQCQKAEIAAVRKYIEDMREAKMSSESILNHVDGMLRQLAAV